MAHFDHDGGPGPWVLLFPVIWAAVAFCAVWLLRRTAWRRGFGPGGHRHPGSPLAVLGRRYAAGEIDAEEYRERRAVLSEDPRPRD
ncbi:SHOCT domain-containing protein [Streptomyces hoynatensis]|uniref:SHOCT domain-containing protein n=1 Tax=Streptomyces hoynatensis TaxID=1141874 RepID=A0A3A9Z9X8_9ACTN|nr:SHOCT domain-containing protein [Streptomyces hoynatensis]RKN45063.1 SHOCT domain-containing protein [Streptomyces hoynatensis]